MERTIGDIMGITPKEVTKPLIGDKVIVRDFKSQGESLGDVEMEVEMTSYGTHPGSATRVKLRSDELKFVGWFPVTDRIQSTDI